MRIMPSKTYNFGKRENRIVVFVSIRKPLMVKVGSLSSICLMYGVITPGAPWKKFSKAFRKNPSRISEVFLELLGISWEFWKFLGVSGVL